MKNYFTKVYEGNDLEWLDQETKEIAVPKDHTKKFTLTPPNKSPNKTEIDIEIFDVEVIEFDVKMQEFTIRMGLKINWSEKRLKLVNSSLVNGCMNAPLAWSPQIDIRSVVVSESRNKELIEFKTDSKSEVNKWNWYDQFIHYLVQSFSAMMTFSLKLLIY